MFKTTIDNITRYGCFSVKKKRIIPENAIVNDEQFDKIERQAFCPGQYKELEVFAPELIEEAKKIWTEEKIAAWKEEQKQYALRSEQTH